MRSLAPADALVYLETSDMAAALRPLIDSKAFNDAAGSKPDLSALKGVQFAVAITGFEMTEEKLTDEQSAARIQPKFVAIADTHAWNHQALRFAEQNLGGFVADIYNTEPTLEKSDKHGGKYFTWAAGERKAHALVIDSLIWFGNDESVIEKSLAVRRGEADSIAKGGKVPGVPGGALASGYVSPDGVAQIASIAGMQLASQTSEESEVQSAIAGVIPQLIRATVTDISWTTRAGKDGYEDAFTIGVAAEMGPVFAEVFAPAASVETDASQYVWARAPSITQYNLEKPNVAWRGAFLAARSKLDAFGAQVIGEFSGALTEPYGIGDAELFLSGAGSTIFTLRADAEGEQPALIARVVKPENVRRSLSPGLKPDKAASKAAGLEILKDEDTTAVFAGGIIIVGNSDAVDACLKAEAGGTSLAANASQAGYFEPGHSAVTAGVDASQAAAIADLFSERKSNAARGQSLSVTRTRFTRTAIERKTTSELGIIGWIASQLAD